MVEPNSTPYPEQKHESDAVAPEDGTYDCAIIGGGPAGLSAAIYLARFNRSALVIDHGEGRSTTHETNENYLGFPEGIGARELRERGLAQAQRFGAERLNAKVSVVKRDGERFIVRAGDQVMHAHTLILATGVVDRFPDIEGVEEYVGRSLFWCITCDGHKTCGKRVAVAGATDEAATTCLQLLNFTDQLVIVTNQPAGQHELTEKARSRLEAAGIPLVEGRIARVAGDGGMMREVVLADGTRVPLEIMISQQGSAPNCDLAAMLGVALDDTGYVKVDLEQRTNVARVYAAGDVTKPFAHQIVTAAHEGATAAISANYDLYRPEQRED